MAEMWNEVVHLAALLLSLNEVAEHALACVWIPTTCEQSISVGKKFLAKEKTFAVKFYLIIFFFFFTFNLSWKEQKFAGRCGRKTSATVPCFHCKGEKVQNRMSETWHTVLEKDTT